MKPTQIFIYSRNWRDECLEELHYVINEQGDVLCRCVKYSVARGSRGMLLQESF